MLLRSERAARTRATEVRRAALTCLKSGVWEWNRGHILAGVRRLSSIALGSSCSLRDFHVRVAFSACVYSHLIQRHGRL